MELGTEKETEQTCFTMNGSSATLKGSVKIVRKPFLFPYTISVKGRSPTCQEHNFNVSATTESKESKHTKKLMRKYSKDVNAFHLPLSISRLRNQNASRHPQLFQLASLPLQKFRKKGVQVTNFNTIIPTLLLDKDQIFAYNSEQKHKHC